MSIYFSTDLALRFCFVRLELAMNVNFAERAHNHNWKLDPIVRSLLDTDFYKLLMLQFIWKNFPATPVTSEVYNRTVRVRLAERISSAALREQMEHVRGLRFRRSELVWLAGSGPVLTSNEEVPASTQRSAAFSDSM